MIVSNELRLGNLLLNRHNEIDIVTETTFQAFRYPKMDGDYGYKGILLTEEWLIKAGFYKINHIHGYSFYTLSKSKTNKCHLDIYKNKTEFRSSMVNNCEYVHQLQNLYFALTGQELEFK